MGLKAQVKNGRLVLDVPTTLPEGTVVQLEVVGLGELDDEERAVLHAALDEGERSGFAEDSSLEGVLQEFRAARAER